MPIWNFTIEMRRLNEIKKVIIVNFFNIKLTFLIWKCYRINKNFTWTITAKRSSLLSILFLQALHAARLDLAYSARNGKSMMSSAMFSKSCQSNSTNLYVEIHFHQKKIVFRCVFFLFCFLSKIIPRNRHRNLSITYVSWIQFF